MKKIHLFYYFVFFVFFAFAACQSCKKDDTPPVPNEKHNYFACKVNGAFWEACGPITAPAPVSGQYFVGNYFDIDGMNSCDNTNNYRKEIYLKMYNFNGVGTYSLGGISNNIGHFNDHTATPVIVYSTDSVRNGTVDITKFDSLAQTISGAFQFTAFNADSNKIVTITEGQMENIHYYKY